MAERWAAIVARTSRLPVSISLFVAAVSTPKRNSELMAGIVEDLVGSAIAQAPSRAMVEEILDSADLGTA
jgi:hypothetical protein